MTSKEESENVGLKLNIEKTKIMAPGPSLHAKYMQKQWQSLFWGALTLLQMMTAAMKLKKHLLLGRKAMSNLDSILKSRDITLPRKVCLVKVWCFQ